MIDQIAMFTADMLLVVILFIVSIFWKEQRKGLIVFGLLYLFFTLLWHFYERIVLFFSSPVLIA